MEFPTDSMDALKNCYIWPCASKSW
jgi:hypothetical protein